MLSSLIFLGFVKEKSIWENSLLIFHKRQLWHPQNQVPIQFLIIKIDHKTLFLVTMYSYAFFETKIYNNNFVFD